jgi:hypothetical protein
MNYAIKACQQLGDETTMAMKRRWRKDTLEKYKGSGTVDPTSITNFLGVYDILILVTSHLHYVDIQNLSLASKSVREVVIPASGDPRRLTHFRIYTCGRGKERCWVCLNQTCNACCVARRLKQTKLCYHLDCCYPYCSTCYFDYVQCMDLGTYSPVCACPPSTDHPNMWRYATYDAGTYISYSYRYLRRNICRQCNSLTDTQLLLKREARTRRELKLPKRVRSTKCKACEEKLGNGPRWWVCKWCNKECRSYMHAAWGRKIENKESKIVGAEKV